MIPGSMRCRLAAGFHALVLASRAAAAPLAATNVIAEAEPFALLRRRWEADELLGDPDGLLPVVASLH